jgi:cytochrome c biogenesis protein CcmG/thiol:disulfide interchange protein DsbE
MDQGRTREVMGRGAPTWFASRRRDGRASVLARIAGRYLMGGVFVWGLTAVAACATAGGGKAAVSGGEAVGRPVPEIVVDRMSGKALSLSSLRGKIVLLDVWASWCVPCKKELPMLDAIAQRLRPKGVEVLAVSIDQKRANVTKFLESQPHWTLTVAHDPRGAIADTLQPEKMPTSYVIDRAGVIRYINAGFEPSDAATIERRLADLAAGS